MLPGWLGPDGLNPPSSPSLVLLPSTDAAFPTPHFPEWPAPSGPRPVATGARPTAATPAVAPRIRDRTTGRQRLTYLLWFVLLFNPQWLLASWGLAPAVKLPLALVALLIVATATRPARGDWFLGLGTWILAAAINMPFVFNRGYAMVPFKQLIIYWIVSVCTVRLLRTPRSTGTVLVMLCVMQYLWWALHGLKTGLVPWDPNNGNFDAYGPLMAVGIGPAYYYATATPKTWLRWAGYLAAVLCVAGVVSSFARGAVLSTAVTVGYIWLRSPHKARTAGVMVIGFVVVALAAAVISGSSRGNDTRASFWSEMSTMFDQSEGSTGEDRKILWATATRVFLHRPLLGAGANNFGAAAVTIITADDVSGQYAENPNTLYDRALHSNYFQILSEFGIVGVIVFCWLLVTFWKQNVALRTREAAAAWRAGGGREDLGQIAWGLEAGMVAYLATGVFYNQLFVAWFFTLLTANTLLYGIVRRQLGSGSVPAAAPTFRSPSAAATIQR